MASSWSATSRQARADVLNAVADAVEANLELFAQAESRDQGEAGGGRRGTRM